jgi:hypothetical protein
MKQGRQARGGSRRQEVEKTWRRRRSGEVNPATSSRCPEWGKRCRGVNLMGGVGVSVTIRRRGDNGRSAGGVL